MTKIDIFSGFLGAGKTTLIKKMISEAYENEQLVLIENEFGEIGIDGGFLKEAGIEITEMNSGCICCSLVGDFTEALRKVIDEYRPDRVIIEPSGVGKLSDVIRAAKAVEGENAVLNCFTTVVDVNKCKMYMKNFGEFFNDQIANASAIVFSHTSNAKESKIAEAMELVRALNGDCNVVTTPWDTVGGKEILAATENRNTLSSIIDSLTEDYKLDEHCHDHDREHKHDEHCHCHDHDHEHEHDEHCHCHDHDHEHEHDEHCHCHDHDHEHEHDEHCHCHCHDHDHEHEHDEHCHCHDHGHHHHADDVFTSFGVETVKKFSIEEIEEILNEFIEEPDYGMVLRAKGIVAGVDGNWIHFDYVPGEPDVRHGSADVIGKICVIGSGINNAKIKELFGV